MPRYTEAEAREAIAASLSYAEALRRLGLRCAGGNHEVFRKWVDEIWKIPIDHFDLAAVRRSALRRRNPITPLEDVLVEGSTYSRRNLKRRLYEEGLRQPICELCGQDENWNGKRMSLILDHINGVPDDNRLENLRIVCPNCNATLDTHCARKNRKPPIVRDCGYCGARFTARYPAQRYCSNDCGSRWKRRKWTGLPKPQLRRVPRPPKDQLLAEIGELGYSAVGRRYGVSDNAIRKWVRQYERERARDRLHDDAA